MRNLFNRRRRAHKFTAALLTGACLLTPAREACAERAGPSESEAVSYNIDAQPLPAALNSFARQSGLHLIYAYEDLAGLTAAPVRGRYDQHQALALLLHGTGVRAMIGADGGVRLEGPPRPQRGGAELERTQANGPDPSGAPSADQPAAEDVQSENIIVTGTRIRGAHPAGANLIAIDRDEIEQTGRSSVQDVLQILPQDFPGSQNEGTQLGASSSGKNQTFASTVDLRGLGADATLTLLNGRRLAPAGFGNFVDISTIPLAGVERIEVLADGASALYGSDAIAGVVNIILRDRFDGAETSLRYGGASRGDPTEYGVSQLLGTSWDGGSILVGYEHRRRSELNSADRAFSASSDFTAYGGSDFSTDFANPGNIVGIGATDVQLAIPRGQDGTSLSEADLLPGVINTRPFRQYASLLPQQTGDSVFLSMQQRLSSALRLEIQGYVGRREAEADREQVNAFLVVPESNAYRVLNNLFLGQGELFMTYNMGGDLGPARYDTTTDAGAINAALIYQLGHDWRVEGSVGYARNDDHAETNNLFDPDTPNLDPSLASGDLDTAFNPFADGSNTNPAILAGLTYSDLTDSTASITTYAVKADGPLFRLWGNEARAAVGAEHRREEYDLVHERRLQQGSEFESYVPDAARTTDAVYGELFLPLVGEHNHIPAVRDLIVSLSVRGEHANDFGDATTPKVGVTWALNDMLALRSSWGQSFKAPQFQQLIGDVVGQFTIAPGFLDPFATNGSTGICWWRDPIQTWSLNAASTGPPASISRRHSRRASPCTPLTSISIFPTALTTRAISSRRWPERRATKAR